MSCQKKIWKAPWILDNMSATNWSQLPGTNVDMGKSKYKTIRAVSRN